MPGSSLQIHILDYEIKIAQQKKNQKNKFI